MLEALIAGERDPLLLADLARGRLKNKTAQLAEALDGRFNDHHAYAAQIHLDHIDSLNQRIISLSDRIDSVIAPLAWCIDLLTTVPGVSKTVAEITMFEDLGSDHFQRTHRRTTERNAISQLHQLGYTVQLTPITQPN